MTRSRHRSRAGFTTSPATSAIRSSTPASRPVSPRSRVTRGCCTISRSRPAVYQSVIAQLGNAGLAKAEAPAWRRVIIEKPFGIDLASARSLNAVVHQHFDEEQVFRIDHYLGKETVQNLLVFRFGNGMYEPVWNRRYIDHVQITAAETVGVERRARVLRGRRRAARHGAEPHDAAPRPRRDGAADGLHRGERARPEDGRARFVQPLIDESGRASRHEGRMSRSKDAADPALANVVRAQFERVGCGRGRARIPSGTGRRSRLHDGDFRGLEAAAGQLALGGRAVLHPYRQAAAEADDRNRHSVPAAAAPDLQAQSVRRRSHRTSSS